MFPEDLNCSKLLYSARFALYTLARKHTCPFSKIEKFIPVEEGEIYDFGCGYGILTSLLAEKSGKKCRLFGFDIDKNRIDIASAANNHTNVHFGVKDIAGDLKIQNARCIIFNDVLYLLPFLEQERLLNRCLGYLVDNGVLVIKDCDTEPFWKYLWLRVQESLAFGILRRNPGKKFYYRSRDAYAHMLKKIGYTVDTIPIHTGYFYPHILYFCRKVHPYREEKDHITQSPGKPPV